VPETLKRKPRGALAHVPVNNFRLYGENVHDAPSR
jgi:hypothetical protein